MLIYLPTYFLSIIIIITIAIIINDKKGLRCHFPTTVAESFTMITGHQKFKQKEKPMSVRNSL